MQDVDCKIDIIFINEPRNGAYNAPENSSERFVPTLLSGSGEEK